MAAPRPHLRKLAEKLGIMSSYVDATGVRRFASDATRMALVEAMGWDAGTEQSAKRSLAELTCECRHRFGNEVVVAQWRADGTRIRVLLPAGMNGAAYEGVANVNGEPITFRGQTRQSAGTREVEVVVPSKVGIGYHGIHLTFMQKGNTCIRRPFVVIAPEKCYSMQDAGIAGSLVGVCANFYSIRHRCDFGAGDLKAVEALGAWVGTNGGNFVGLNPLHAIRNRRPEVSPYSPSSRWFLNPLYLNIESVPEYRHCAAARKLLESGEIATLLGKWGESDCIDYDAVYKGRLEFLRLLFGEFSLRHGNMQTQRGRDYARFVRDGGYYLHQFTTFCALDDHFRKTKGWVDQRDWPRCFRDSLSVEVDDFRASHAGDVGFHIYLQFEMDRQLQLCKSRLGALSPPVGLYLDIAVGSVPGGSDAWENGRLFAKNVEVGCPPDAHSTTGQNWSFAAIDPWGLRDQAYTFWSHMLRNCMQYASMVRIDHVMGLMRQFWIPKGRPPSEGAYVKYPFDEMVGVLALESHKHKCMVVGEDLGTVPRGFSELLEKRGILSTRMMMFERSRNGGFKSAKSYRRHSVTSATSHDLPPLKGYVDAADLELRRRIGLFKNKAEWLKAVDQRKRDVKALLRRLVQEKLLSRDEARDPAGLSHQRLVEAVHGFLAKTPSRVIAVMLDDLFGETEPINLPGVGPDQHASWTRRMSRSLEDGLRDKQVVRLLKAAMPKKRKRSKKTRK